MAAVKEAALEIGTTIIFDDERVWRGQLAKVVRVAG